MKGTTIVLSETNQRKHKFKMQMQRSKALNKECIYAEANKVSISHSWNPVTIGEAFNRSGLAQSNAKQDAQDKQNAQKNCERMCELEASNYVKDLQIAELRSQQNATKEEMGKMNVRMNTLEKQSQQNEVKPTGDTHHEPSSNSDCILF